MSKNVAVFVDVANIFYAAKAAGVDIDYVTLLKASSAGRDLVRAYAYTGLDPENENQRNFHDFLRRHGYKVVSKDIRKYGDGKVKANLDIELVVDMMKTARNLDIAIVVSGDGDFAPAIRAVQEMGVRVEVLSFRGNTSSDLIDVADIFTDITQVAKVEKGSSRSGRRVADDEEDLSMTEVPDKMTEGTGDGRRRRGGRSRSGESSRSRGGDRGGRSREEEAPIAASAAANGAGLVALPGEKLSRASRTRVARPDDEEAAAIVAAEAEGLVDEEPEGAEELTEAGLDDNGPRRRRRRGGRGRGRGRGRGEGLPEGEAAPAAAGEAEELEDLPAPTPRRAAFSFGSVWDSQLGVPAGGAAGAHGAAARPAGGDLASEEDLEEPEIPEYLLAERRQRDAARNRGGRAGRGGRGSAYAAAMERERFGSRGTPSRYAEPPRSRDLGGRGGGRGERFDRPPRADRFEAPRSTGGDPWSEVPPEIEAMLRAQLTSGGGSRQPAGRATGRRSGETEATTAAATAPERSDSAPEVAPRGRTSATTGRGRGTTRRTAASGDASEAQAAAEAVASGGPVAEAPDASKPATTRRRATRTTAKAASGTEAGVTPDAESAAGAATTSKAVTRRASASTETGPRRSRAASTGAAGTGATDTSDGTPAAEAPKRRATRRKAEPAAPSE
ncbi:MAG TPA: NYN domain-containing protein [Candidatus Limnocylindrales bacterium]|nr:NYN domain-containing protein [Candidatus Limnocylindrales bacterium]